jgi:hypothetical protein
MALAGSSLLPLILKFIGNVPGLSPEQHVRQRMDAAIPNIVEKMGGNNKTPATVGPRIVVHKALFHLWDCMLPGEIADQVRDHQDENVWNRVKNNVTAATSLEDAVKATRDATLALTF